VIQYPYNDRRQLSLEGATTLGGSTDGSVLSIKRDYDSLGRLRADGKAHHDARVLHQ
jgi:hypothetical protein